MAKQNDGSKIHSDHSSSVPTGRDCSVSQSSSESRSFSDVLGMAHRFSLNQVTDGLNVSDRHGKVIFVNDRLCQMLGCTFEELIGKPTSTFLTIHDDPSGTSNETCPECGCFHRNATIRRKDGSLLVVALDSKKLVDTKEEFFGTLDVIMDVTEKALLEQTLRDNAEWHRLIVDNLNDIFWVAEVEDVRRPGEITEPIEPQAINVDDLIKRWHYLYLSRSFEQVYGYPLERGYEMNLYDMLPESAHEAVKSAVLNYACEVLNSPERVSVPRALQFPLATADGAPCWSETTARMLYDDSKGVLRIVGITRDVTETHLAEVMVRASEEKFSAICSVAQDAVIMMDADGNATYWNPAAERMFGYRAEEILGRHIHTLLAPRRIRKKVQKGIEEFRRSGKGPVVNNVIQSEAVHKDGTEFPVEIAVSPLLLDGRRWAVGIVRDVTERSQAEEAVQREQRRLAQLLDVYEGHRKMATYEIHDGVTQPLVSALMTLDAFSQIRGPCPDEHWKGFDNAIEILREVVEETRRFMSGMRPPVLDELGVVTALEHLVLEHRVANHAQIEYRCDVTFERLTPPLETTIFRVIQEGLANAQQHSQSDKICVELVEQKDRIRILVEDWGVGFNPAKVSNDHFGLEGIRERAAAMGGSAQIDSTPGGGTRIVVDLPLLKEQPDKK